MDSILTTLTLSMFLISIQKKKSLDHSQSLLGEIGLTKNNFLIIK